MIQVKEFYNTYVFNEFTGEKTGTKLDDSINAFIKNNHIQDKNIIDIKYGVGSKGSDGTLSSRTSALLIYTN